MSNIGCRIIKDFKRPPQELIESFRGIPVANIDDCMNRMAAMDAGIKAFNQAPLLGTALTIKVPYGDNLMLHKAVDIAKPGDILVIQAEGSTDRAILGDLLVAYFKVRGIAGLVLDGAIRDVASISRMDDFPVYARGVTPNGPYKNGPGEVNYPVCVGGQIVHPGDIIYGDMDGVIAICPDEAAELIEKVQTVIKKEAEMLECIKKNQFPRPWVDETLEKLGCTFQDNAN